MNNSPLESKNDKLTNSNLSNKNNLLEMNYKSGLSFNKAYDKDYSANGSKDR